jgi:hypothetical protein
MIAETIKLEVEVSMYLIMKNPNWKWWRFWEPKIIRQLTNCDEFEKDVEAIQ